MCALLLPEAGAQTLRELGSLSLDELAQIEVTSVSKRPEALAQSPAAVYVITGDDIRRSGAASLPEALRLAPNLEVARVNSQAYTISARGFNSVNASNKVLVLIDGRSVFTPFFNSVFWDQQEVMLADIDRIEVISGPGGTLWGANAVNGVINVITRRSGDTQGGLVDVKLGDLVQRGAARWGGTLGTSGTWRTYALGYGEGHTYRPDGTSAADDWHGKQAGFRADFGPRDAESTVQGDIYENRVDSPSGRRSGGNLLGRWVTRLANGSLRLQGYYDEQNRSDSGATGGSSDEQVKTLDIQLEHDFTIGSHAIVWGVGQRTWRDRFTNTANPFVLSPESETVQLSNIFAQDTVSLARDVKVVYGVKVEYSSFSQWAVMPDVRIGWQATPADYVWAAVSRAVRPPSRIERDLTAPGIVETSPQFQAEKLTAYEAGWRTRPSASFNASVSIFYNDYTDLRTTSLNDAGGFPVHFGNGLEGHTYGLEAWAGYSPVPWWRLNPGITLLHKDFHLEPGATDIAGIQTSLGHDPGHQFFLHSYMDLPHDVELYAGVRQIGALDDIGVESYWEADLRLGWHVTRNLELSLAASDVLHVRHAETSQPPPLRIPRSAYAGLRWAF
ncbi:MAG TPA: TonB-dependent receptor plug domain-containing protein [Casimicrobiaceae bacterium]|jgi:iron complex outermembrane receptor protein